MRLQLLPIVTLVSLLPACSGNGAGGEGSTGVTGMTEPTSGTTTTTDGGTGGGSSTTGASTTGDESGGSTGDGGAFLNEPDLPGIPSCDLWSQDCPDGEKCVTWDSDGNGSGDANRCVDIAENPKQPGDPCDGSQIGQGIDDCDLGSYCSFLDDQGQGICIPMCTGTPAAPQCPANHTCSIDNDGTLISCTQSCDPVVQDCLADIAICMPAEGDPGFSCATGWGEDGIDQGEECYYTNSCKEGLFCAAAESLPGCVGAACCTPYCSVADGSTCTNAGEACVPFFEPPVPGFEDVGVCLAPD